VSGDGGGRLLLDGRDMDSVTATFSTDFALGLAPVAVARGRLDLKRGATRLAYVDALGFHPNLAIFATAAIPAKLGLPNVNVAYLELRDAAGALRVSTEQGANGLRIFTPTGVTIPLVVPALQAGRPTAPRASVAFDVTLDPFGQGLSAGAVTVALSPADQAPFDLSALGLPLAVDTLAFDRDEEGGYRFAVGGILTLCQEKRGIQKTLEYLASNRVLITYELPFNEVVLDFYDRLKTISRGYASLDYHVTGYWESPLVKLDILVNGDTILVIGAKVSAPESATGWPC
jgi:hypothetical protein